MDHVLKKTFLMYMCEKYLLYFYVLVRSTDHFIHWPESSPECCWQMGQKDSRPSYNSGYDYGNSSAGYNSRYSANTPSGYSPRYAPSAANNVQQPEAQARLQRMYSRIGDDYRSVGQVCVNGLLFLSLLLLFSFQPFDAWFSTWCSWSLSFILYSHLVDFGI
jgi:hypothetical protein